MKTVTIHGYLTRLVWLCLLPPVLLASGVAALQVQRQQVAQEQEALALARNTATIFDRRLEARIAALQVLAASARADDPPDLRGMYQQAQEFHNNFGVHVIMADLSMQMLFNTRVDYGSPLPRLPVPKGRAAAPLALATGKPAVGDLFYGPVAQEPLVAVVVPVLRAGAVSALLLCPIETKQFQQRLQQLAIPTGWRVALLDSTDAIIANIPPSDPGQKPAGSTTARRFVSRLAVTPWSVALDIPRHQYYLASSRLVIMFAGAILAVTLLSLLTGWLASRRLRGAVNSLTMPTADPQPSHSVLTEIETARKLLAEEIMNREAAQKELRESEQRYADLYEHAPDMYLSVDAASGIILNCNTTSTEITGFGREELIGRRVLTLFHPDSHRTAASAFQTLHDNGTVKDAELRMVCKDGSAMDVSLNASADRDDDGKILYSRSVLRDITEKKKLEERLRHAQKMEAIGTLAGGIAHDFNNILTSVLGYAELIRQDLPSGSQTASDLDQVISASKRATDLVRQILTFSRRTEKKQQPLEIQHIAKEALKLLRPSLPTTIEIHQDIDSRCPAIMADPSQIHQVIMNLCANSYQAMADEGGILSLTLSRHTLSDADSNLLPGAKAGAYLLLTVSDTGCGMDRQTREKIFEPYYTTKAECGGTGLGLAVVHGIVNDHGGHISVYSEPGQGTTFKVYFPVPQEVSSKSEPATSAEQIPMGRNEHLLFVDDEQAIVELGRRWLEKLGYRVTSAVGADEALAIYLADPNSFDLVITDLSMPRMSGIELAKKILAGRPELPIILCTGFGDPEKMKKAEACGIRHYMTKPVTRDELAKAVREILVSPGRSN